MDHGKRKSGEFTKPSNVGRQSEKVTSQTLSDPMPTFKSPPVKLSTSDLFDPTAFMPSPPVVTKDTPFHKEFVTNRDKYVKHNNHLGRLPEGLKNSEKSKYMKQHQDDFPVIKLFTGNALYHYTSPEGAQGIQDTSLLYPSIKRGKPFTHFGKGVYFTDLGPDNIKDKTHDEVQVALFTKSSDSNRKRTEKLLKVDVSDMVVMECRTTSQKVFLNSTTEPLDVNKKIEEFDTSSLVKK